MSFKQLKPKFLDLNDNGVYKYTLFLGFVVIYN